MLNIMIQWQTMKFRFFVLREHYEKLGHMLKPLVAKFHSDLPIRLRDIAEKTGPREAETDSKSCQCILSPFLLMAACYVTGNTISLKNLL